MCFADSALLSQVKPLNIWVSSGIASMQKSIVHLPKKQWFVVDSASSSCYCTVLDKQQLYSAPEVATFLWLCACTFLESCFGVKGTLYAASDASCPLF